MANETIIRNGLKVSLIESDVSDAILNGYGPGWVAGDFFGISDRDGDSDIPQMYLIATNGMPIGGLNDSAGLLIVHPDPGSPHASIYCGGNFGSVTQAVIGVGNAPAGSSGILQIGKAASGGDPDVTVYISGPPQTEGKALAGSDVGILMPDNSGVLALKSDIDAAIGSEIGAPVYVGSLQTLQQTLDYGHESVGNDFTIRGADTNRLLDVWYTDTDNRGVYVYGLQVDGDLEVNNLVVVGSAIFEGDVFMEQNLDVDGDTVLNNLTVEGDTHLESDLYVDNIYSETNTTITFHDETIFNEDVTVQQDITINGDTYLGDIYAVGSEINFYDEVTFNEVINVGSTLNIEEGDLIVGGTTINEYVTNEVTAATPDLQAVLDQGNVATQNINLTGNFNINGHINMASDITGVGELSFNAAIGQITNASSMRISTYGESNMVFGSSNNTSSKRFSVSDNDPLVSHSAFTVNANSGTTGNFISMYHAAINPREWTGDFLMGWISGKMFAVTNRGDLEIQDIRATGNVDISQGLGIDLVIRGNFGSDPSSYFTNIDGFNWQWDSGGVGRLQGLATDLETEQDVDAEIDKTYKVVVSISDYSSGSITVGVGGATSPSISSNGVHTNYLTATTTGNLIITPSTFDGYIDYIEVYESKDGDLSVAGDTYIGGNLVVEGETTTVNTTNMDVEDKNITINKGTTSLPQADGAGITVERFGATDASLVWDETDDVWKVGILGSEQTIVTQTGGGSIDLDDYMPKSGGTFTGQVNFNNAIVTNGYIYSDDPILRILVDDEIGSYDEVVNIDKNGLELLDNEDLFFTHNSTFKATLQAPSISAHQTITLPSVTGTVALVADHVLKAGDTMSGTLNMNGNNITGVHDIVLDDVAETDIKGNSGVQILKFKMNGSSSDLWIAPTYNQSFNNLRIGQNVSNYAELVAPVADGTRQFTFPATGGEIALANHNHDGDYAPLSHSHPYLSTAGGTMNGDITFSTGAVYDALFSTTSGGNDYIGFGVDNGFGSTDWILEVRADGAHLLDGENLKFVHNSTYSTTIQAPSISAHQTITLPSATGTLLTDANFGTGSGDVAEGDHTHSSMAPTYTSRYANSVTGNDTTGDGTSGNPYKTLDRVLEDVRVIDRNTTVWLDGTFDPANLRNYTFSSVPDSFNRQPQLWIRANTTNEVTSTGTVNRAGSGFLTCTDSGSPGWGINAHAGKLFRDTSGFGYIVGNTASVLLIVGYTLASMPYSPTYNIVTNDATFINNAWYISNCTARIRIGNITFDKSLNVEGSDITLDECIFNVGCTVSRSVLTTSANAFVNGMSVLSNSIATFTGDSFHVETGDASSRCLAVRKNSYASLNSCHFDANNGKYGIVIEKNSTVEVNPDSIVQDADYSSSGIGVYATELSGFEDTTITYYNCDTDSFADKGGQLY